MFSVWLISSTLYGIKKDREPVCVRKSFGLGSYVSDFASNYGYRSV